MRSRFLAALLIATGFGSSAGAQSGLYLAPAYFNWQESLGGGVEVEETGWRALLGYRARQQRAESGFALLGEIRLYGGTADYDGFLQILTPPGGLIPDETTTDYAGLSAELGVGYQWILGDDYSLTVPSISVVGDFWWRGIQGRGGYDELWLTVPLRTGIELGARRDRGWLAGISLKAPVYTLAGPIFSDVGWVELHPKARLSGDAELGYRFNKCFSLLAFFDSYWFGKSSAVSETFVAGSSVLVVNIFQPESKMYTAGLKAVLHYP